MAGNAAQEARRTLKPKSRRPNAGSRGQSPSFQGAGGDAAPQFSFSQPSSFAPPAAQSFSFDGGFTTPGVNNPFTGFSSIGQDPSIESKRQEDMKRQFGGDDDSSRKRTFGGGGFSSTMNSQSTNNMFGAQPASSGTPNSSFNFNAPSGGSVFGNQAPSNPSTSSFQFPSTSAPSSSGGLFGSTPAPSQTATNSFAFSQPQTQTSGNNSPIFGNGGGFNFGSNPATNPLASTTGQPGSILAQAPNSSTPKFSFGQTQAPAANQTPAKATSFTFGQSATQAPASSQTPALSTSFPFGSGQAQSTASIFSNIAAPTTTPMFGASTPAPTTTSIFAASTTAPASPSLFGASKATPATASIFGTNSTSNAGSSFKLGGDQPSNMFSTASSKPTSSLSMAGSSIFTSSSQAASSTLATSSAPTNLFQGIGAASGSQKPTSGGAFSFNSGTNSQTPKTFTFGETAKPQDSSAAEKPSTPNLFGSTTEKPATSNIFGTSSASTSQFAPSSSTFQFGKPNDSATTESTGTPTQQNDTNGATFQKQAANGATFQQTPTNVGAIFSFPSTSSNQEPKKDEPVKNLFTFGQAQPSSQPPQPSSTGLFGSPNPAEPQKESNAESAASSDINGATLVKDSGSSPSKSNSLFGNLSDPSKTATSNFAQKHKPVRPSPLSQSMTGSPDVDRAKQNSLFQGTSQVNGNFNPLSSIFESPSKKPQESTRQEDVQRKKEYDAAKRLRALCHAVKDALGRMPVTADVSKLLMFYETRRQEILKDVVKSKRKAVDDGTDVDEGSGPIAKRQRQNNGKASVPSPQKFVSSGESFKDNEDVQAIEKDAIFGATPNKLQGKQDKMAQAIPRPTFESPLKQQSSMFESTTPRGPPPKNIFAAQALKTPAPIFSKEPPQKEKPKTPAPVFSREPPQTEKPKSTTSLFATETSTLPRNPPSKTNFAQSSEPSKPPLFSAPKATEKARDPSPQKPATSLFPSGSQSSQTPLFGSVNKSSTGKATAKEAPQLNGFGSSPSKEPAKAPSASSKPESSLFSTSSKGSSNIFGTPSKGPSMPSSSQQSIFSPAAPSGSLSGAADSPITSSKRNADLQLTKDAASEKTPVIPSGKRKADKQLTKDDFEAEENTGNAQKTPRLNGSRSETSKIFKNILDSPQASPQKKMFSLNKSDASAPRPNPFASLGVPKSPVTSDQPATPKATAVSVFGSPVTKSNGTPKPLFSAAKSGSNSSASASTNLFQKSSSSATPSQSSSTNGLSFGSMSKPAAPAFVAPSPEKTAKMPVFAAASTSGSAGNSIVEEMRLKAEAKALKDAVELEYDSDTDGAKDEWIKKWKAKRATKYQSNLKIPSFGAAVTTGSGLSIAEQIKEKTEAEALKKALDADYDSEDDGDREEWIKKWKANRAAKAKELSGKEKPVFIPGKGFSFSSQDSNSPEPEVAKKPLAAKSIFEQPPAFSTDVSQASSPGPTTSANGSVLNGRMPIDLGNNIFANLSDSDFGKNTQDDDESNDEASDGGHVHDDEKKDPTYDPAKDPQIESPDSPVDETGPGIASAKKQSSIFSQTPSSSETPKVSLFDRMTKDSDGNLIRELPVENKENTQPSSPFSFFKNSSTDKTWNQNTPIKFGTSSAAPTFNFTAATPSPQKTPDSSASVKAPATVSGSTPATTNFGNLFGSKSTATTQANPFGSLAVTNGSSSSGNDSQASEKTTSVFAGLNSPSPFAGFGNVKSTAATQGSSLFGTASQPGSSAGSSGTTTPAASSGLNLFGTTKTTSLFANLGDNKPASVGFSFGGASPAAISSLVPSATASTSDSRATTPGATTDNDSNAPTETSNDPDAEHHEQIDLASSRAGQEDEDCLYECRAKGMSFEKSKWAAKGIGLLRVLRHKETGATRTLLRMAPGGQIILNKGLVSSFNYEPNAKTVRLLVAADDAKGLETWLLQVKTVEMAIDLAKILEENKPKSG